MAKKDELSIYGDGEQAVAGMMVSEHEAKEAAQRLLGEGGELAPQVVIMQEGNAVQGYFMGYGDQPFEFTDDKGEIRSVKSVIIRHKSGKASVKLIGNHNLVAKLDKVEIGREVLIVRGGLKSIGKGRWVAEFQVVLGKAPVQPALSALKSA